MTTESNTIREGTPSAHPASLIIVLKCVISDKQIAYLEIDTGLRSWCLKNPDLGNPYGLHLGLLAPKSVLYELDVALRFANTAEEAMAALERLGFPQKLKVSILRVDTIAQRIVIDLVPNRSTEAAPLPARMKISRKKKGEGDDEVAAGQAS